MLECLTGLTRSAVSSPSALQKSCEFTLCIAEELLVHPVHCRRTAGQSTGSVQSGDGTYRSKHLHGHLHRAAFFLFTIFTIPVH